MQRGYAGLLEGSITPLAARDVSGIIQRGGTILGSARSQEFKTEDGQRKAIAALQAQGIYLPRNSTQGVGRGVWEYRSF
jgi:6-phosphofructokinase 1